MYFTIYSSIVAAVVTLLTSLAAHKRIRGGKEYGRNNAVIDIVIPCLFWLYVWGRATSPFHAFHGAFDQFMQYSLIATYGWMALYSFKSGSVAMNSADKHPAKEPPIIAQPKFVGSLPATDPEIANRIHTLSDSVFKFRLDAIKALINIGPPAVPALIEALNFREWLTRRGAAEALGAIGDPRAIDALSTLIEDPNAIVNEEAMKSLSLIADVRILLPLFSSAKEMRWVSVTDSFRERLKKIGKLEELPTIVIGDERQSVERRLDTLIVLRDNKYMTEFSQVIGDIAALCNRLYDNPNSSGSVRRGAKEVLTEYERHQAKATLLRPSERDPEEEKNSLLRPAVGTENTIPHDRLLRPTSVIEEKSDSGQD